MFDGFWSGVLGGLFGPFLIRFFGRFKFANLFVFCVAITPLGFFLVDIIESGWTIAVHRILSGKFWGLLLGGAALGAIAVLTVWISLEVVPKQSKKDGVKQQ
jgi:hypothetical protein